MTLYNINNSILSYNIKAIEQTANLIKDGYIIALKGIGGFHIVCDATNDKVVNKLREIKNRPNKPFAVMFSSINSIKQYTNTNYQEEEILTSKEKPIVIVKKRINTNLSLYIAPNILKLGCIDEYKEIQ